MSDILFEETPAPLQYDFYVEPILLIISFALILVYHLVHHRYIVQKPENTVFGFGRVFRTIWVEKILSDNKHAILGVQSIRNEIFIGIFIAKSAFVAVTVVIAAASSVNLSRRLEELSQLDFLVPLGKTSAIPSSIKISLVLILFGGVFLCSTQYLRLLRHMSVLVGCSSCEANKDEVVKMVAKLYDRAAACSWWANRQMLMSFPAVAWAFGPTSCLLSTIIIVVFMIVVDWLNLSSKELMTRLTSLSKA
mmetsp:Transcript_11861/g.27365  ORF Transcript_11861/g.27365 Transcript_11861/m.27365 type:complete len:250 (+) Transcript_11861:115-864(+)